jgi:hypothetical protein
MQVRFANGLAVLQKPKLPLLSCSRFCSSGKVQPVKLLATCAAEPVEHTRHAAAAGAASSRLLPRTRVTHIMVEPCTGPVVLQLVQQDTAAAAEAAAIKSELLASCRKSGTLEQQLQLEAGDSTSNLTLCVRNDCGELLDVRAMQLEVQGSNGAVRCMVLTGHGDCLSAELRLGTWGLTYQCDCLRCHLTCIVCQPVLSSVALVGKQNVYS